MTQPLEGNLGSATDEEWLAAHEKLVELVRDDPDFPDEELSFIWDNELDPTDLIDPTEVDHGPADDSRKFHGGGG